MNNLDPNPPQGKAVRSSIIITLGLASLLMTSCKLPSSFTMPAQALKADLPAPSADAEFAMLGVTSDNDTARFLAGLPGRGGAELANARRSPEWKEHARQMNAAFGSARGLLDRISSWRRSALTGVGSGTVFYPFSGPDFLFADAFFPRGRTMILCGLEPVGSPPDISRVSSGSLPSALANVRSSIATPLAYSYFITKDMRNDLNAGQFRGVTPILYTFLARTNHRVLAADPIALSSSGAVVSRSGSATGTAPGIRIKAASASGGVKTIYYFRTNLSNSTLGRDKRFVNFVRNQNPSVTFVKSASYLLHGGGFSIARSSIESLSPVIVQDPTGIPYQRLAKGNWDIKLYGNYQGTLDMFKSKYQGDLASAYQKGQGTPTNFGIGYKMSPNETSIVVARKR